MPQNKDKSSLERRDLTPAPAPDPMAYPPRRLLARIASAVFGSVLLTAAATALAIAWLGSGAWWTGWLLALLTSLVAATASLAALAPGIFFGVQTAAQSFLAAAAVRTLLTLAACIVAALTLKHGAAAMMVITIPMYFAQLLSEAIVLGTAYWPRRHRSQTAEEIS